MSAEPIVEVNGEKRRVNPCCGQFEYRLWYQEYGDVSEQLDPEKPCPWCSKPWWETVA